MEPIWEIAIAACLAISGVFGLVGSFGLIKLPTPMMRLHAPTKATTLGVGGVLIASMLYFYAARGTLSFHELMITLFLFLTAPVTAHFVAKATLHSTCDPDTLPRTDTGAGWATYDGAAGQPVAEEDEAREAGERPI